MDSSPLVKAHDHARAAAVATRQAQQATTSDTTVAISEHTHAAGEFANAARSTTSLEALRTLKLLEEHHRRLAEILKLPPEPTSQTGDDEDDIGEKANAQDEKGNSLASPTTAGRKDGAPKAAQMPGLSQQRRSATREMSSSIASNLASARGIRSKYRGQPLSPSVSNDQAPGNVDPHPRRDGSKAKMQDIIDHQTGKPTWVPPTATPRRQDSRTKGSSSPRMEAPSPALTEDAGYARFYNTFGSLINKISAPLAFAGLPLIQEEPTVEQAAELVEASSTSPTTSKRTTARPPPTSLNLDPDLSKIYSKATMRALAREGHSASDSFYVVPTSGHTMSYANILTYAEKEKRRLEASAHGDLVPPVEEDDDDFVDARETLMPLSPGARRKAARNQSHTEKGLRNTIEELSMENKSLKDMLDNVSKRLHAFEASSQHSAMALAESYRVMRPGSPSATHGSGKALDDALRKKAQDMEEQLAGAVKQMERLEKDNRKMQKTLDKYREKWEMLKAGAKARREAQAGESVEDARQS
ncbi:CMGC kinase [Purpureocillium lavendulum]|uniref:CMGC kinase n=1 Tax=Purpureocillium lavendulum TaxID=1247861 RepID=A0AB34FY76_9HYPO|nr:CMGC kinase [Purpureocillium lavendulum]